MHYRNTSKITCSWGVESLNYGLKMPLNIGFHIYIHMQKEVYHSVDRVKDQIKNDNTPR